MAACSPTGQCKVPINLDTPDARSQVYIFNPLGVKEPAAGAIAMHTLPHSCHLYVRCTRCTVVPEVV